MPLFEIDGSNYLLEQLKIDLPSLDLIAWLSSQPLYPKVFWKEKESHVTRAAIGSLLTFPHIPHFTASDQKELRLYGGMRFGKNEIKDETWQGFPPTCFWLPQIEISQENGRTEATIHYLGGTSLTAEFHSSYFETAPLDSPLHSLFDKSNTPEFPLWQKNVNSVLDEIVSGRISKLVLARKSSLRFTTPLSVWPLLSHLNDNAKQATVFAFQLAPNMCFLGATPEKLFHRKGNSLSADAVAGTRRRGKNPAEDLILELDLKENEKERREFQYVREFLEASIAPLSEGVQWQWPQLATVLKASHVQHLYNRLSANLKPGISDAQLIQALHPTPALGGFPRESALPHLQKLEPFDRGWYGAPIGFVGSKETSLYVGIRSGLVHDRSIHLFAGTGLVAGSIPEREWDELELKTRPFTEFLTAAKI